VHLDPQLFALMALTSGAGWLMIEAGVFKRLLDRRQERRVCPSCGRASESCTCA